MKSSSTVFALIVFAVLGLFVIFFVLSISKQHKIPAKPVIDLLKSKINSAKLIEGELVSSELIFESGWVIPLKTICEDVKCELYCSGNFNCSDKIEVLHTKKTTVNVCCKNKLCKIGLDKKVSCS
jgi:hypothetical protein